MVSIVESFSLSRQAVVVIIKADTHPQKAVFNFLFIAVVFNSLPLKKQCQQSKQGLWLQAVYLTAIMEKMVAVYNYLPGKKFCASIVDV